MNNKLLQGLKLVFLTVIFSSCTSMLDIEPETTPFIISMLYLGYLVGAPISFLSESISRLLGDERTGLLLGLAMHTFGLTMLLFVALQGLIVTMFFLAAGFFLIHALLSGLANHLAREHKGVVNGV